jgi:pimeloyl-ACP methyl ester carboxylesterase
MQLESTDGVTIALHDLGGDGDPLMICHATGFCGRAYEPLAAELGRRHHVWALDFRGHGDSTPPDDGDFDWRRMTSDLEVAIDAVAGGPIPVVGHSMGGAVSMLLELRRPGTLQRAYLFEPIILPDEAPNTPTGKDSLAVSARMRRPDFPSKAEALRRYASRPPLGVLRADALAAYVEHGFADQPDGTAALKCRPEHEAATFEAVGKPTWSMMTGVAAPTTIAVGAAEPEWTPASFGAGIVAALPNGRLDAHPLLGHFGPLQDPVAVARGVLAS